MGVSDRDLGHVADDVARVLDEFGKPSRTARPGCPTTRPTAGQARPDAGAKIVMSGEYPRMQDTFREPGFGLVAGVGADVLPDGRAWTSRMSSR